MKRLPGVKASRGCTEPTAIALAAGLAARAVTGEVLRVTVACDRNTLKNAQAPGIPGTGGLRGAALAAALGAVAGDPARGLEVLGDLTDEHVARAGALLGAGEVEVVLAPRSGKPALWVEARVTTAAGEARAVLADAHTHVVTLEVDGRPVPLPDWASAGVAASDPAWDGATFADVLAEAGELDPADAAWLLAGLRTNLEACGADDPPAAADDLAGFAEAVAERGSLARMTGEPVTIVTSGYSGNQGLVATIPVWAVAGRVGADEATLAGALALSHLVGSYVRSFTGILSSVCNATQAASAGAAAACAHLLGGDRRALEQAAVRVLATSAGVVCDGAKPACALKVGLGAGLAIRAAQRVVAGTAIETTDGVAGRTLEETAANLGRLAYPGMARADEELLETILAKADPPR